MGHGVEASTDVAMELYSEAARQSHVAAICNVGYLYLKKKEYEKASTQ
ncbi:MAG: hypothetical protein ACOVOG_15710, partial [Rubrivivax sp.]